MKYMPALHNSILPNMEGIYQVDQEKIILSFKNLNLYKIYQI